MEVTRNTDEQAVLWNGRAGRAWVDLQEALDHMFKPVEALLVREARAASASSVLDVGCGTGSTTLAMARLDRAKVHSVGVDISEPMIAAARARAEQARLPASFVCADAQRYAFEPASFDLIVSRFGVMFFDDPVQAFSNLRGAAREQAELRLVVWRAAAENPFMTAAERAAAPFLPNLPARKVGAPGQFAFADPQRVQRVLEDSGWASIGIRPIDLACSLPEPELSRYTSRLGPVGAVLQEADDATRSQVSAVVRAAFEPYVHGAEVRFSAALWLIEAKNA